jgi:hypothetical protein
VGRERGTSPAFNSTSPGRTGPGFHTVVGRSAVEAVLLPRDPLGVALVLIFLGFLVWFVLAPRWWARKLLELGVFLARFFWMLLVRLALFIIAFYFRLFLLIFAILGVPGAIKFVRVLFGFEEMRYPLWP